MAAPPPPPPPPPKPVVSAVGPLKLPTFWGDKPALWFAHAEAQFELHHISSQRTRHAHVLSRLDQRHAAEVEDLLLAAPTLTPYTTLKHELIRRLSASEETRVREILTEAELGDRRPTQFLRHLKALAGTSPIQENLLRQLWLRRLPAQVQGILAVQADVPLERLSELADRIVEVSPLAVPASIHAVAAPPADLSSLERKIAALAAQVDSLVKERGRSKSRSRAAPAAAAAKTRASSATAPDSADTCWYHTKWGDKATKCRAPCRFHSGNE